MLQIMDLFISKGNGLSIMKFVHSETQDRKSLVNAHFAISIKHFSMYVAQGNDVTTSSGLVTALQEHSGLANSAAEIFRIRRDNKKLNNWEKLHGSTKNGLPWISRNNEYVYGDGRYRKTKSQFPTFAIPVLTNYEDVNSVALEYVKQFIYRS